MLAAGTFNMRARRKPLTMYFTYFHVPPPPQPQHGHGLFSRADRILAVSA